MEARTVAEEGWSGTRNGALLRLAETSFDVFVTADRGLPHQQTVSSLRLGIVVLALGSTKLEILRPAAERILEAVSSVRPGELRYVRPG